MISYSPRYSTALLRSVLYIVILASIVTTACSVSMAVSTATTSEVGSAIPSNSKITNYPQLLWEKKLNRNITSSAISNDGSRIAIADETGYLAMYNVKGEKLWDYHHEGKIPSRTLDFTPDNNKAATAFMDLTFDSNGNYLIADLCVLNTYTACEGPAGGCQVYKPYQKICFNSEGKI